MKVLHVITSLITGGAQTALYRVLTELAGASDEHAVVCLGAGDPFADAIRALGVRVWVLNGNGRFDGPRVVSATRSIASEVRPDVILGWMYDGNLAATWAARGCGAAVLWNVRHSVADLSRESRGMRLVIRANAWLSGGPKAILFNSAIAARQHVDLGFPADSARVVPNGFDTTILRPLPEQRARVLSAEGVPGEAFVVGKVARAHPMKDHANLLTAAESLLPSIPNLHLLLAGPGVTEENAPLRDAVRARGLEGRVRLLGARHDIAELNSALDVAVSASAWGEGFSNAIAEAMACGRPVVATDVGDAADIVGDCGLVVPPRAPGELAAAIRSMETMGVEGRSEMGARGRARVEANYALDRVAGRYEEILREAWRQHGGAR